MSEFPIIPETWEGVAKFAAMTLIFLLTRYLTKVVETGSWRVAKKQKPETGIQEPQNENGDVTSE